MIRIERIEDRDAWNALVNDFPSCDLRQSYEWGETRRRQGWQPLRLAARVGDRVRAALAVQARRAPAVGVIAYAPRAPMMALDDEGAWAALPELVRAVRREIRPTFLRISPPPPPDGDGLGDRLAAAGFVALPDFWSLWNTPRNVMRLSLDGSEREVLGRMAAKRRQHISTAAKKGITARLATSLDDLRAFYALLVDHAARERYVVRDWSHFEALHAAFASQEAAALAWGMVRGQPVSALFGVRFGPMAYLLYAPSTPAARGTAVGDVVHWEWLRWAKAAGCREVDFGSSNTHVPPRATDTNIGIYRFKVELGCRLVLCPAYHDYVYEPLRYRIARTLERAALSRVRGWLTRLPAGVRAAVARRAA